MIQVTVRTILHLAELLGTREMQVELPAGASVMEVIVCLADRMGNAAVPVLLEEVNGVPQRHLRIMVNGQDIGFLEGLDTVVRDGDDVLVLPPAGGG